MTAFVPSVALNRAFYAEVVGPLVVGVPHAAALLGWGSDVLGYDTERSTDHGWGPRLLVFVGEDHVAELRRAIEDRLPDEFRGWPTRFSVPDNTPPRHHVVVISLHDWLDRWLGVDARGELSPLDWLLLLQQQLLGVTRGAVYHDDMGELSPLRARLEWFPDDVWRWMLACQWKRVAQEEAFVGRAAEVGDELGSRIVVARLARELMRVCFLLEREYWPYSKWFGAAFSRLTCGPEVGSLLRRALDDPSALVAAYEAVAAHHNGSGLTESLDPTVRQFFTRGFLVLAADRFADACVATVDDEWLRSLPLVGSVDQVADSTDVLSRPDRAARLRALYSEGVPPYPLDTTSR